MKRRDALPLAIGLWAFVALAWPDAKVAFGFLGGAPGSSTTGLNLYLSEASGLLVGVWALLSAQRRQAMPRWAWGLTGGLLLVFGAAMAQGLAMGWHPRNVLTEARVLGLLPPFLAMLSLDAKERPLLRWGLLGGVAIYALQQALLIALEPKGLTNLNIVPLPVVCSSHDLSQQMQLGALILLVGGLALPRGPWAFAAGTALWSLLWLSYLRALWVTLPLAALLGAALWDRAEGWRPALRYLGLQSAVALVSLGLCLGSLALVDPDGGFLLRFRIERTAQALGLLGARPMHPTLPQGSSPVFKHGVQRGVLYTPLGTELKPDANQVDPSGFDRGLMRRKALEGFKASPLLGQGLGALYAYQVAPGVNRLQRDPHSGYAWLLGKFGLLGLAALAAGLAFAGAALWRRKDRSAAALGAVLALVLLLDVFQCSLLQPASILPLLLLAALLRPEPA